MIWEKAFLRRKSESNRSHAHSERNMSARRHWVNMLQSRYIALGVLWDVCQRKRGCGRACADVCESKSAISQSGNGRNGRRCVRQSTPATGSYGNCNNRVSSNLMWLAIKRRREAVLGDCSYHLACGSGAGCGSARNSPSASRHRGKAQPRFENATEAVFYLAASEDLVKN